MYKEKEPKCGSCYDFFPFWGTSRGFCRMADRKGFPLEVSSRWEACPYYSSVMRAPSEVFNE